MPTVGNYDVAPDGRFLIGHGARQQCDRADHVADELES
jgi:hypothetical protein